MKIQFRGVVSDVYQSEKSNRQYLTITDLSNGAPVKMGINGQVEGLKKGMIVNVNAEIDTRVAKDGGLYLSFVSGEIKKEAG